MTLVAPNVNHATKSAKWAPQGNQLMNCVRMASNVGKFFKGLHYQHGVSHINERNGRKITQKSPDMFESNHRCKQLGLIVGATIRDTGL